VHFPGNKHDFIYYFTCARDANGTFSMNANWKAASPSEVHLIPHTHTDAVIPHTDAVVVVVLSCVHLLCFTTLTRGSKY
jgi:hypothetical protein